MASDEISFSITINEEKSISVSDSTISQDSNTTKVVVKNEGNTLLSNIELIASGDFNVTLSQNSILSLKWLE